MLTLHHSHHLPLPHLKHSTGKLALSPVQSDGDELIESIEQEQANDTIQLENTPDIERLDEFWTGVEEDLKKDPGWFDFADD